jgi:predicted ester cyclase
MSRIKVITYPLALVVAALLVVDPSGAEPSDDSAALAERAVAMWNRPPEPAGTGDYGGEDGLANWQTDHPADDLFMFGHVLHVPGHPEIVDSAGPRFLVAAYRAAFPDLVVEAEEPSTDGDRVTVLWTLSGTSLGPFAGLAPTGRPYAEQGSFVFRVHDDQIVETWVLARTAENLRQAGAVPLPEQESCRPPAPGPVV